MKRATASDRAALEQLVLHHRTWVYIIAVRMVFHPQDAEDVTQEVLVEAVTRLSTTWLRHILNQPAVRNAFRLS